MIFAIYDLSKRIRGYSGVRAEQKKSVVVPGSLLCQEYAVIAFKRTYRISYRAAWRSVAVIRGSLHLQDCLDGQLTHSERLVLTYLAPAWSSALSCCRAVSLRFPLDCARNGLRLGLSGLVGVPSDGVFEAVADAASPRDSFAKLASSSEGDETSAIGHGEYFG